jgi:hypothetical protein
VGAQVKRSSLCDICNHFSVTADKLPCVVDGLAGPSLFVCVSVLVYISNMDLPLWASKCSVFLCVVVAIISP